MTRLGQNNPFILMEVLQYLLDVGLARLLSRRTIGVLDPERFRGLVDLPDRVEDLYRRRLAALAPADPDGVAHDLLCAASFLGPDAADVMTDVWPEAAATGAVDLLTARRFLMTDARTGRLRFVHENLYNFVRRWLREGANGGPVANRLLDRPGLGPLLAELPRGELNTLAGRHEAALELLRPVWDAVQSMTNFSSEQIDLTFYGFLPAVFESADALDKPPNQLAKVACAVGYMGVHNYPLVQGEQACERAERMLAQVYGEAAASLEAGLAIEQLRSHALQNIGRTGLALRRMLEMEARFREAGRAPPAVAFDLYDRLQEHFRRANHTTLMDHYGRLATGAAQDTGDTKLLAAHFITMSLTRIYRRGRKGVQDAERALRAAEENGIERFVVFNQLTRLVAEVINSRNDSVVLREAFNAGRELLRIAAFNTFSDSIVRLHLLLATLAPHVESTPDQGRALARRYVAAGHESSIRFGIGLYDWALDNLAGALDHADPEVHQDLARQRFMTCLERLRRRGLTFVGDCSGSYPNVHAISNIVRFQAGYRESDAMNLLMRQISAYDAQLTGTEEGALAGVGAAIKGRALFWPSGQVEMLRLPGEKGYFTPIF